VLTFAKRANAVKCESSRAAENDYIAVGELYFHRLAAASRATELEGDW